ncbi:HMG-I and HMG-Y DNA-binding domain protein, partial [mine drainage metagenome]
MILKEGDLIQYGQERVSLVRVLWITETGASVVTIEVEAPKALPVFVPMEQLEDDLQSERAKLLLEDAYQRYVAVGALKARSKAIRDRAWRLIERLVNDRPNIYVAHRRSALVQSVQECAAREGRAISHNTLYGYLRRYWQRGLTPNALLPDYTNCGGRGKERRSGKAKRGRPRQFGDDRGINITAEIRQVFRVAVARCYASDKKRKWNLLDTYEEGVKGFFFERTYDTETGRVVHLPNRVSVEAGGVPTFRQF